MAERRKSKAALIKDVLAEVSRLEKEAQKEGRIFVGITEEQLKKKLERTKSPMIVGSLWNGTVPAGGTLNYDVYLFNPDPTVAYRLFVHFFVGPGNMVPDSGAALATVDTRFPRLTLPKWIGITLGAQNYWQLAFAVSVPAGIPHTNYLGNAFLFKGNILDVDEVLDRASAIFEVT
jgi:hypothetical protein